MKTNIIIKTQFEAIHAWPNCPLTEVQFLRNPHRHIFYVTMKRQVSHNDRDVEFIMWKRNIEDFIEEAFKGKNLGSMSCEMIAERLMQEFYATYVSVFEDNENGAEVIRESIDSFPDY